MELPFNVAPIANKIDRERATIGEETDHQKRTNPEVSIYFLRKRGRGCLLMTRERRQTIPRAW